MSRSVHPHLTVLGDDDAVALEPAVTVEVLKRVLREHHAGALSAPARTRVALADGELVFTSGASPDIGYGFRAYETVHDRDQVMCLWGSDGRLELIICGTEVAVRRVGGLGAIAADLLARHEHPRVGILGSGPQAWAQIWALTAVRDPREIIVHSPRADRCRAFATRIGAELGLPARVAADPRDAVVGCDIVITATSSSTPVLRAEWLEPDAHVNAIGPKSRRRHELPADLSQRTVLAAVDSAEQARRYPGGLLFDPGRLVQLGELQAQAARSRVGTDGLTVYLSTGLAGAELALARWLRSHCARPGTDSAVQEVGSRPA